MRRHCQSRMRWLAVHMQDDRGIDTSSALAQAVIEYFAERSESRTKRLLVHRYPSPMLQRCCEHLLDYEIDGTGLASELSRPITIAYIQPVGELAHLASYRGRTYGCSPDWPVKARDDGGLL